jgi:hypothetical protein
MLGGCNLQTHTNDDPLPPANTWALWAPLSDAGEALYNLATNVLTPTDSPGQGQGEFAYCDCSDTQTPSRLTRYP